VRLCLAAGFSLALAAAAPGSVWAQGAAQAAQQGPPLAHDLTRRAIELLFRGEEAATKEEKLALYREGEALARQAVALDDNNADAHYAVFANYGRRLLLEGVGANPLKLLEVNRELDGCLELNPQHSDALAARGGLYRQLPWILGGNLKKAEEYLSRAVALNPRSVGAHIELACTYLDLGEKERAIQALEAATYWAEKLNKHRQLGEARALLAEVRSR